MGQLRSLSLTLALGLTAGCTHVLAPPATPEPVAPEVGEMPEVPEGRGRLVIDVVDGPTQVLSAERRTVTVQIGEGFFQSSRLRTEPLCVSPCVADLPLGRYLLAFPSRGGDRIETDEVWVSETPTGYRRALGSYQGPGPGKPLGVVSTTLGGMAMVVGLVFLPVGLGTDEDGMALAGGITLGTGAALVSLGIVGIAISPTRRQPGAAVTFALP